MTVKVEMYSKAGCPYCIRAAHLFKTKGVEIVEIGIDFDPERTAEMRSRTGRRTVPQIYIGATYVGGCDDLYALESDGKLDALLQNA